MARADGKDRHANPIASLEHTQNMDEMSHSHTMIYV